MMKQFILMLALVAALVAPHAHAKSGGVYVTPNTLIAGYPGLGFFAGKLGVGYIVARAGVGIAAVGKYGIFYLTPYGGAYIPFCP